MPFRIAKSLTIESGHLLSKHPGACRFPHGHSRTVEIVLTAEALDACDMVCDFKVLKAALLAVTARYDHAFAINTSDPQFPSWRETYGERVIGFSDSDPTTEAMAREMFHAIERALRDAAQSAGRALASGVRLERIRVNETASSWAEYWPERESTAPPKGGPAALPEFR